MQTDKPKRTRKPRKTGKPKDLDTPIEDQTTDEPTMEEFVKQMHGQADTPQNGLPSLEWLKEQYQTKSAAVRYLIHVGFEVKDIAKHMGMRYQHVRNVSKTELKRGPNEDWRKPLLNPNNPLQEPSKPVEE